MNTAFHELHHARLQRATRPFKARGHLVQRCPSCFLAQTACLCAERQSCSSGVDFVLLMHPNEILKPTNTGRLIADILPHNTFAFEWQRLALPAPLVELLNQPQRQCVLVFPSADASPLVPDVASQAAQQAKRLTFILLDGTWKQARKMVNTSAVLAALPSVVCQLQQPAGYLLRKAAHAGCLSTAEAAIALLHHLSEPSAPVLADYFTLFNQRYQSIRGWRPQAEALTPSDGGG